MFYILFDEFTKIQVCNETPALQSYFDLCVRALDKCAPNKSKYIRANNSPFKVNQSRYIALFVFSGSIKKLFTTVCVNIFIFSQYCFQLIFSDEKTFSQLIVSIFTFLHFFSTDFGRWKNVGLPQIAHIVIH